MKLLTFSIRHLLRYWRMNVVVLVGLVLTAVFLSGLPMYATAISGRSLAQKLADAPVAAKNIQVQRGRLTAPLYGTMQDILGPLLADRMEIKDDMLQFGQAVYRDNGHSILPYSEFLFIHAQSFSDLSRHVQVIDGRLPDYIPPVPNQFYAETEFILGQDAIARLNLNGISLQIGDQLRTADGGLRLNLVGVVAPIDATSQVWWGDLLPFSYLRPANFSVQPDTVTLSALLNPRSMPDYFPAHQTTWRILTDLSYINVDNVDQTAVSLQALETQLQGSGSSMNSELLTLIQAYQAELSSARVTLFLLAIQSLLFVLYTLTMLSSFLLDRSRGELATMAGRGFTGRFITIIFAIESGVLALVAAPVGPWLALLLLKVWGTVIDTAVPSRIPTESWQLTLIAVTFGWITLVATIYFNARGTILAWQQQLTRPPQQAGWQRTYLDFFMLILGGLIYWQLTDTGSFLTQAAPGAAGGADPLLLVGPSLLLIGVALIFLRLFPLLLRLFAWLTRTVDSLILPFGLAKLSRDPVGPSRVVLLVSLAAGLTLFTSTFENSLRSRQVEMANYLAGANLRVEVPNGTQGEAYMAVVDHPAIQNWSPAYLARTRWSVELGRTANMVAVNPDRFAAVSSYAPGLTAVTVAEVMTGVVQGDSPAIPAVVSLDMYPRDSEIGDRFVYFIGQEKVTFEVRGFLRDFPGVDSPFFITNLTEVEKRVDLARLSAPWEGAKEVWLQVDAVQQGTVVAEYNGRIGSDVERIVADAQQLERGMQSNMVGMQAIGAFNLNAVTLLVLSVGIFLLVHFFAAQRRLYEFSLLRSMGLSARQLFALLSLEGAIMMVLGLLAGSGLGFGLAAVMRPFLSRTLSDALGGDTIRQLVINLLETSGVYGLLIALYAIALGLLLLTLMRGGIHRTLRIGEE